MRCKIEAAQTSLVWWGRHSCRTPAASIESSATSANLTEAEVNDVLQSVYEETGSVKTFSLLCGPNLKKRFKDFTQTQFASTNVASAIKVYNQTMDSKKIINTVDIYEGDFGNVAIVPSLFINRTSGSDAVDADAGLLIDPEYVSMMSLKAESVTELENQGGGRRGFVDVVAGLACLSPVAHGYFN